MLNFHGKFVQTDSRTTVKQYAPDLSGAYMSLSRSNINIFDLDRLP